MIGSDILLLTLEMKGLSSFSLGLTIMKAVFINQIFARIS